MRLREVKCAGDATMDARTIKALFVKLNFVLIKGQFIFLGIQNNV